MRRKPDNTLKADIRVVFASSGSGKSEYVRRVIRRDKRVIVFDVKNEYDFKKVHSPAELLALVRKNKGPGKYSYAGPINKKSFDAVCRIAFIWGRCRFVAEELQMVTSSNSSPDGWKQIITQGRAFGVKSIAISPRPQLIDKTVIGAANVKWVSMLERADDKLYMAKELGVEVEQMPDKKLHYLMKENGNLSKGVLKFR